MAKPYDDDMGIVVCNSLESRRDFPLSEQVPFGVRYTLCTTTAYARQLSFLSMFCSLNIPQK